MEEIEKVVTESAPEQTDVNTETVVETVPEVTGSSTEPATTIADQLVEKEVDEKGVSYKNRFHEMERKYTQVVENIPQIIQQTISEKLSNKTNTQQEPQSYTIEQIEQFVSENPQYKAWGEAEKGKLIAKNAVDELEKRLTAREQKAIFESKRSLAESQIKKEFPEIWTKDSFGREVLDPSNPVVREIAGIMQDPDLQRRADGLYVATELAYSRLLRRGQINSVKKETKLKQEVKKLEKKTFTEGGQKSQVVAKDELNDALEQLKKTGSKKDQLNAVSAYFKKVGYIQ